MQKEDKKTGAVVKTWLELENSFVRFVVFGNTPEVNLDNPDECWKNQQIRKCWQSYYGAIEQGTSKTLVMDYLTGNISQKQDPARKSLFLGKSGVRQN